MFKQSFSAITGRIVSKGYAARNPKTTVTRTVQRRKKRKKSNRSQIFKAKSVSSFVNGNAFCIGELYITLCVIPMCININHEFPKICKSSPLFYTKYYEQRCAKDWNINMSRNPTANVGKEQLCEVQYFLQNVQTFITNYVIVYS